MPSLERKIILNRWLFRRIFVRLAWMDYRGIAITPVIFVLPEGRNTSVRLSWIGLTFTAYLT